MTSHKAVVSLLLLVGVLSAFNLTDYLYDYEKNASVSYTNFTDAGVSYSIVRVNGLETFLLKSGEPLANQSEIDPAIYSYYVKTYYPSESEISELEGLIKKFNDSRNDGYDFKNKEEYICRDDVLLSNGKISISGVPVRCVDNATCQKNALLLFSVYGEGLNLGSPSTLIGPLTDFTPTSLRIDELLGNYTKLLDGMNESNMADSIDYIEATSPELKNLSLKIEATIFRTPRLNDTADRKDCQLKCFAICPSFDLDQSAAEGIKTKAAALSDKIAPLSGYQNVSALIYNRTLTRMEFVRNENLATYYNDQFRAVNSSGAQTISFADDALKKVQNNSLRTSLDKLKSLHTTIPEDIGKNNFSTIDSDISDYKSLADEVQNGSVFLSGKYNETVEAKNEENSLLLILESKDLDPVSMKSLDLINNKTSDLNAQFRDGLTLSQLDMLTANYTALTKEAQELLKTESETPATRVLLLFRGFARRVNTGIAKVAENTDIMPKADIPESPAPLAAFSSLTFLSLSSMALLVFLYIFASRRFTIPKTAHILAAAFVSLIVLLFVFSLIMYLFLGKTSTDATLPEFLADFGSKNSTMIVVDLRNASFSDAEAMRSCAYSLADSFGEKNKTWALYTLTPNACSMSDDSGANSSLTADQCLSELDSAESSFLLSYAAKNEPPKFSVIYQNRAEIGANLDYYESCPLVALFS